MPDYEQDKARRANLTNMALSVTEQSVPTPTQEENDKTKLGLMHPDEKAVPSAPEMPSAALQAAYLASPVDTDLKPGMPLPPEEKPPPEPPLGGSTAARQPERTVPREPAPPRERQP